MKLFSKALLLMLLASGLTFSSCGSKTEGSDGKKDSTEANSDKPEKVEVPKVEGWETYDEDGVTFQYPSDWRMEKDDKDPAKFTLFAPEGRSEVGNNINMMKQQIGSFSLDSYVNMSLKEIEKTELLKNVTVDKNEKGKIHGREYAVLSYTGEMMDIKMRWLQRVYIIDGTAYLFTYTGQVQNFDSMIEEVTKIFDTFNVN